MQPRLTRSRTDVMLAGVCGGLGEYFAIDPVLVRIIFVLVTLTSGLGIPVYFVMWLVMPKGNLPMSGPSPLPPQFHPRQFGQHMEEFGQQISRDIREAMVGHPRSTTHQRTGGPSASQPPEPSAYNFDPRTGQPLRATAPRTGQTINLGEAPQMPIQGVQPSPVPVPPPPQTLQPRQGRNWRTLGIIMIGIGGLIFLSQLDVNLDFVFPLVLIVAGIILMRRRP